jgi:fermentation-respiration switch protein FrsA (DUF1100 family)
VTSVAGHVPSHKAPSGKRFGHRIWRILRIGLLIYLGIVLMFAWLENSLVYFPSRYPKGDWSLKPGMEDAWFESADGTRLHGWFLEVDRPRAVVLFCHGNGGSIAGRRGLIDVFRKLRVSALLWSYRGYGRSSGSPLEAGVLQDARAARTWLAKRSGVPENQIVLWGESLGGAVAVDLAQDGARSLILESTFTAMPEVAHWHYPWLPTRTMMKNRYNSIAKIPRFHGPLLQFHGNADTIVPYAFGRQLFSAANEPKQFVTNEGADHNDPRDAQVFVKIDQFLDSLPINLPHPN